MKFLVTPLLVLTLAFSAGVVTAPAAEAGSTIKRACMKSDRSAASKSLCTCIQRVADQMLTRKDQRQAAKFFKDPHRAQEIRQSDNSTHEAFWKRYKAFGNSAGKICS